MPQLSRAGTVFTENLFGLPKITVGIDCFKPCGHFNQHADGMVQIAAGVQSTAVTEYFGKQQKQADAFLIGKIRILIISKSGE